MVPLDVPLEVAAPVAGEGAVAAGVWLGAGVDPEVAAERGAAGELAATRPAEQSVGRRAARRDALPAHHHHPHRLQHDKGVGGWVLKLTVPSVHPEST